MSESLTPWTAARQAPLSITNSRSVLRLLSVESVIPSNHRILCRPLLLLPSIFPSIRVFSNESALYIRWPKYWSFSSSINPSNEYLQRKHMPNHRVAGFKYLKFFLRSIYLILVARDLIALHFSRWLRGLLLIEEHRLFTAPAVKGDVSLVSGWGARALGVRTSVLWLPGARALAWSFWQGLGSSTACGIFPDQGSATFIDRQLLNHWPPRKPHILQFPSSTTPQ